MKLPEVFRGLCGRLPTKFDETQLLTPLPRKLIIVGLALLCSASVAAAGDFVLGIGQDNLDADEHSEAWAAQLEYHTDPIKSFDWGSLSLAFVAEYDEDGDIYAGAGLAALWDLSQVWFVEGGLAAGYYDAGSDSVDLGGNLQFRTLVGLGYRLNDVSRLSLSLDHLSNAGIEDVNPGRNAIHLRYARSF